MNSSGKCKFWWQQRFFWRVPGILSLLLCEVTALLHFDEIPNWHMELNGAGEVDPMHDSDKVADIDLDKGLWLQISGKHWVDGGGNHVVCTTKVPACEGQGCSSSEWVSCLFAFLGRAVRSSTWTSLSPQPRGPGGVGRDCCADRDPLLLVSTTCYLEIWGHSSVSKVTICDHRRMLLSLTSADVFQADCLGCTRYH